MEESNSDEKKDLEETSVPDTNPNDVSQNDDSVSDIPSNKNKLILLIAVILIAGTGIASYLVYTDVLEFNADKIPVGFTDYGKENYFPDSLTIDANFDVKLREKLQSYNLVDESLIAPEIFFKGVEFTQGFKDHVEGIIKSEIKNPVQIFFNDTSKSVSFNLSEP